ncbi:MAG TPA: DUF1634 domain-containing protein [Anaeromyxobacteraceae bacterium]|nr:DUF1634 domain-containing protein [Anaeromyxobacteraceae bacterium]
MNRAVAAILRLGTLAGVALAAAATAAYALRLGAAPALARAGVLVLLATPPVRLAVVAVGFGMRGERPFALAALAALAVLAAVALLSILGAGH